MVDVSSWDLHPIGCQALEICDVNSVYSCARNNWHESISLWYLENKSLLPEDTVFSVHIFISRGTAGDPRNSQRRYASRKSLASNNKSTRATPLPCSPTFLTQCCYVRPCAGGAQGNGVNWGALCNRIISKCTDSQAHLQLSRYWVTIGLDAVVAELDQHDEAVLDGIPSPAVMLQGAMRKLVWQRKLQGNTCSAVDIAALLYIVRMAANFTKTACRKVLIHTR